MSDPLDNVVIPSIGPTAAKAIKDGTVKELERLLFEAYIETDVREKVLALVKLAMDKFVK